MRSKSILLLALALGCGLVASIGISQIMEARSKTPGDDGDMQPIFVAMTDINANDVLSAQVIKLEEWPKKMVPVGALTKLEDVEGKRCRTKLYQGEPILAAKLLGSGEAAGAANQIPSGYRVAHVKVDSVTGGSNLILPGDRVNVLVFRNSGDMSGTAAKIVLQDIKVFAVDTHTETEYSRTKTDQTEPMTAKTIALLVTPQQSIILHAASEISGAVKLVLRNPDDEDHTSVPGITIADIFGPDQFSDRTAEQSLTKDPEQDGPKIESTLHAPPIATVAERTAAPWKMVVMYGSELKEIEFPGGGNLPISKESLQGGSVPPAPLPDSQPTGEVEEDAPPAENQGE